MARYLSIPNAARIVQRHPRSVENWVGNGFIVGYRDADGKIRVDLDEIERAFKTNPRMRDGRKPFGPKAKIVPMPVTASSDEADQ